ncbi:glycosyltransferase family 8 protein [Pseudocolwellia sp. HL-MZ7]|uniref:glycosyltransferase family 8 protein n=1 Tax=Pseudocolwellia sp. HL-MZ7 TaxID=3400627 RepID=UPI003CEEA694
MKQITNHICFCADGNYILFVPSVIESILNSNTASFVFHVISDEKRSQAFDEQLNLITSKVDVVWHQIDIKDFDGLKEISHFTKAMYYRLLIPELINESTVLYLDCDILVKGKLDHLFSLDLDDNYIGAVTNPFFNRYESLNLSSDVGYFNSGVMLINTQQWLDNDIKNKLIHIIKNEAHVLEMPDQDALNKVFNGKWHKLSSQFNAQFSMFFNAKKLETDGYYKVGINEPIIVHFSGTNKQWHYSCSLSYARDYRKLKSSKMITKRSFVIDNLIGFYSSVKLNYFGS